jgi:hypothetical protein
MRGLAFVNSLEVTMTRSNSDGKAIRLLRTTPLRYVLTAADGTTCTVFGTHNSMSKCIEWGTKVERETGETDSQTVEVTFFMGDYRTNEDKVLCTISGDQWRILEMCSSVDVFAQALVETKSLVTAWCIARVHMDFGDGECWPFDRHDTECGSTIQLYLHREVMDVTEGVANLEEGMENTKSTLRSLHMQLGALLDALVE